MLTEFFRKRMSTYLLFGFLLLSFDSARSEVREFEKPMVEDARLDRCLDLGRKCGRKAAHRWCKDHNFEKSIYWEIDRDVGFREQTRTWASRQVCDHNECDAFRTLVCYRNAELPVD
ncbi:MAG: hypothetical protein ACI93R_002944 [Flavobacteriales bacterium]|jgi:hypothetical protein